MFRIGQSISSEPETFSLGQIDDLPNRSRECCGIASRGGESCVSLSNDPCPFAVQRRNDRFAGGHIRLDFARNRSSENLIITQTREQGCRCVKERSHL